jgi:hypothetical protein
MPDPILIRCEGSGWPPATGSEAVGMCQMCGQIRQLAGYSLPEHTRQDILAMVERGDFDTTDVDH